MVGTNNILGTVSHYAGTRQTKHNSTMIIPINSKHQHLVYI